MEEGDADEDEEDEDEDDSGIDAMCVTQSSMFENMSEEVKWAVLANVTGIKMGPEEPVMVEGEAGDCMYWLKKGQLDVSVAGRIVSTLSAPDFFGERALLDADGDNKRTATVSTVTKCELLRLSAADFRKIMAQHDELLQQMATREQCYDAYLQKSPVFEALQANQSSQLKWDLSKRVRDVSLDEFTVVCEQGMHGDCMYWVKQGRLEVLVGGAKVAELQPGDHFGEVALLDRDARLRTSSVRTITACALLSLTEADFLAILARYPDFADEIATRHAQGVFADRDCTATPSRDADTAKSPPRLLQCPAD